MKGQSALLRILMLEDNPADGELVRVELRRAGIGAETVRVATREDFEAQLDRRPDAILSDYQLPQWTGLDALKLVRGRGLQVPFIIVSGTVGEELAVETMRHGADDYLLKDRLSRLGPALTQALERKRSVHELQQFRMAMDVSVDSIYLTDPATMRFVYLNDTACKRLGYSREELLRRGPQDVLALTREQISREFDAVIAAGDRGLTHERRYVRSDGRKGWTELHRQALRTEGGTLIVTIGRDITERRKQQRRIERLSRVHAVQRGINALLVRVRKRGELFKEACRIAVEAGKFPLAWIAVADRRDQRVTATAWAGDEAGFLQLNRPTAGASGQGKPGLGAQAIAKRGPVLCNDIEADGSAMRYPQEALARGYRSAAALPLLVDGTAVAALVLYAAEARFFDDEETKLLTELAGDISFALSQIKKAKKLDRLTRVNAMLSRINGAIVRIRDRQALFDEACRIAVETGGLRYAWLNLVDEVAMRLRPVASAGVVGGYLHTVPARLSLRPDAPEGHGIGARSVLEKRALVENDVQRSAAVVLKSVHAEHGIKSMAAFPLFIADRVVGNLVLHSPEAGFFDDDQMRLLSEVAANIAFALEHIEKEEKVERLTRVHAVLSGINALIVRVGDRDELFREACRIAVEAGGFSMAWLGIVDRKAMQVRPIAWHGSGADYIQLMPLGLSDAAPEEFGLAGRAVMERTAIVSDDMTSDPRVRLRDEALARGFHALVMLPLMVAEEAAGVLALYAGEIGFFDEDEMKLLRELAGDIAFALDHLEKEQQLDYLAYFDALTGVANRSLFIERLKQNVHAAGQAGGKVALVLADVERLRTINESLGRQAGDALLKQVAERLVSAVDATEVGRIGADQFAIVLPSVKGKSEVARNVEKLSRDWLGNPFRLDDAELRISAKAGITLFPNDGADAETLLRNAEAALIQAKESGERHTFYASALTHQSAERLALENRLRQALEKNEFILHYQPKVELETRRIVGAEALIRWQDPERGMVPPGQFIPLMEETGLILDVGAWALTKAVADHARWLELGLASPRVAVNVSAIQLRRRTFLGSVQDAIRQGATPPGIDLEITESLAMEDVENTIEKLKAVRELGVSIAIDDFGTGYSSLGYLAKLPAHSLKIDRSFIVKMVDDRDTMTLVQTIISLAQSLRLKVVAEGVDSEDQAKLLRLLRCDEMQGYLFSKPLPFDDLTTLLRNENGRRRRPL